MCDCRKRMNEKLKPLNARLAFGFTFGEGHMDLSPPIIQTEKLTPRGKRSPTVLATFCPFCGAAITGGKGSET